MMTSKEKSSNIPTIINLVNINDVKGVENILISGKTKVDEVDENGMTALQHAAYKGQADICRLLLSYGADVNADRHDHNYSALHFGALSGSLETVQLLLSSGSKTLHQNSLGRTAAQMAGFVGNHAVVSLINNYVPLDTIEYYSIAHNLETEPKIPKSIVKPLYNLIMQPNLHPVYIALTVGKDKELLMNCSKASKLCELLCEKEAKRPDNVNEVLCLKFHHLYFVLNTLKKEIDRHNLLEKEDEIPFENIIKKLLHPRLSDGFEEYLESYIVDSIKAFPYREMPLFLQLVRNKSSDSGDVPTLTLLHSAINGQRAFQDGIYCGTCGLEYKEAKACAKCKKVHYCDKVCQKLHWSSHKKFCSKVISQSSDSATINNKNDTNSN